MTRHRSRVTLAASIALFGLLATTPALAGDTYKVLHRFNGKNGEQPAAGLTFDTSGNLYGTTFYGGTACTGQGCGTAFQLVPNGKGGWTEHVLHNFCSESNCADGWYPEAALVFDAAGNLYGTTRLGGPNGNADGGGTVFQLVPDPDGAWTENVLYGFCAGCAEGDQPIGPVVFDVSGNLYGTTTQGGAYASGVVFELVHGTHGTWTEKVLYSFCAVSECADGEYPFGSLIFDPSGNLYGETYYGGNLKCEVGCGTIFELIQGKGGAWSERVIHSFNFHDGAGPNGLVFDGHGNLYGAAALGGLGGSWGHGGYGVVFRLSPGKDGTWTETVIRYFHVRLHGPGGPLVFDRAGNLYGTTYEGGGAYGYGIVFKLSPSQSGTWTLKVLHWFNGKAGENPVGGVILDAAGNLYGTTVVGGVGSKGGDGIVFEITP